MITHAEYLKHAQFVREAAIRNGDLWTAMTLMAGSDEAEAIRKSQKIVNAYGWQRRMITCAELQTNMKLVHEAFVRHGDLRIALWTLDNKSEVEAIRRSLQILRDYDIQNDMLRQHVQNQHYNSK